MAESQQRLFIGVEIEAAIKDSISEAVSLLEPYKHACRWVPRENIHLTMRFLGDCTEEQVETISAALESAASSVERFSVAAAVFGAFPNSRRARILWLGLKNGQELQDLYDSISGELERIGFPAEERRFHPHITFGRVKKPIPIDLGLVEGVKTGQHAAVDKITLFRSRLSPSGAKYEAIGRYFLGEINA